MRRGDAGRRDRRLIAQARAQARAKASGRAPPDLSRTSSVSNFWSSASRFVLGGLGLFDLRRELGDRALQIVAARGGGARVGRIGEMARIGDARALFLVGDLAIEIARHAGELRDHRLDLPNASAFLLELKALQPNDRVPRLHLRSIRSVRPARDDCAGLVDESTRRADHARGRFPVGYRGEAPRATANAPAAVSDSFTRAR